MSRVVLILVVIALFGAACSSGSGSDAARAAVSSAPPSSEVTTTASPTTSPRTTLTPTTLTPTTEASTTVATSPPVTFPPGDAGSRGELGCVGACRVVGYQDLDGRSGVVLEDVIITNPTGRCITMRGASDVVIRNVTITDCGTEEAIWDGYDTGLILIEDASDITIENSVITRMAGEDTGAARNNAVQVVDSTDVQITNNAISDVYSDIERKAGDQGNRAISVQGDSSGLTIEQNTFRNAGRNALQLARARDLTGVSFSRNVVEGRGPWDSDYEDMISIYSSSGTADDPIVISDNYLRNGGPSVSGTAMILGDGDPANGSTAHVVATGNVIVNPGHAGIVLAGGRRITVTDNIIFGDADVVHATTAGMAINDYGYTDDCSGHIVTGNRVYMANQQLDSGVNHAWIPGTCTENVVIEGNVFGDEDLNASLWVPRADNG